MTYSVVSLRNYPSCNRVVHITVNFAKKEHRLAGTPKAGEAERGGPESTISVGAFYRYIHQEMETEDNFKSFLMTAALCVCF